MMHKSSGFGRLRPQSQVKQKILEGRGPNDSNVFWKPRPEWCVNVKLGGHTSVRTHHGCVSALWPPKNISDLLKENVF